ncbi:Transcriptional regulatory protein PmrA [Novosphingobium sp. 9U]|nr:Transcriptional regulatory protein PmrA [Novosphingobium sp. 9U]
MPQLGTGSELLRVLIVEDDRSLARGMEALMATAGFALDCVSSGEEAIGVAVSEPYNLIILDLGLPDMDGLEVLSALRRREVQAPILILTARRAVNDRIEGLDRGADDYLSKPFHPRELQSRARALIRRALGTPDPVLRVGSLSLDRSTRTVALNESVVDLRRREMAVLETLMGRPGKVVTRECLTAEVFNFADAVAPNALDVYVGRLRRKLTPHGPTIRTVRGLGYMLEGG